MVVADPASNAEADLIQASCSFFTANAARATTTMSTRIFFMGCTLGRSLLSVPSRPGCSQEGGDVPAGQRFTETTRQAYAPRVGRGALADQLVVACSGTAFTAMVLAANSSPVLPGPVEP